MIKAPNVVYLTTPNATMVFANFMFKTGLIKDKAGKLEGILFPRGTWPPWDLKRVGVAHWAARPDDRRLV